MRYTFSFTPNQLGRINFALLETHRKLLKEGEGEDGVFLKLLYWLSETAEDQEMGEYLKELVRRAWSMPSKHTFKMKPIKLLLEEYVSNCRVWIDPFAGFNSPVEYTNDLNPKAPTTSHCQAIEFVKKFKHIGGILFDPPYSPRQISECYKSAGLNVTKETTQNSRLYKEVKDAAAKRMISGSIAISCGWNSVGFGKERGFQIIEVLIVSHGSAHNDTIVVVEVKK